ncbi:MAG: flagellar hook-length control protein FliK [Woeseiaceae bacterium]|nr:flagellar hook-length control protein FliK [Woeseiaceae bacterium]
MLATLNLQLSTLDLSAGTPAVQGIPPIDGSPEPAGFAALLQVRVADTAAIDGVTGDALPATGNPLPELDIEIMVDGVAFEGGEADTPLLPVADEQPWESLVTPPGLELQESSVAVVPPTTPEVETAPLAPAAPLLDTGKTLRQAAGTAAGEPVAEMMAGQTERSPLKPTVTPIPANMAELSREIIGDARDTRIVPGIQTVVPREIQPRDMNVTQVQQGLVQDDGQPVLQDTIARPTAATLQQTAPVIEEGAEMPRPVVQPGVTQGATPTPVFQPGAFANVAPTAPQADSTFASTLQNQLPDLIETPVRDANWGDKVGERVVMMANNQLKTAEIRLTPAELGPVRVQVNVEDGAANITFQAQHAATREALEQALPRLREMFAESGLSLGQTSVGEQNVAGNRDGNERDEARATGQGNEFLAADNETPAEQRLTRRHEGLLDTFV